MSNKKGRKINNSKARKNDSGTLLDDVWKILKLPFVSKEKVTGDDNVTIILLSSCIAFVFKAIYLGLLLFGTGGCLYYLIYEVIIKKTKVSIINTVTIIILGFSSYVISGAFRIAGIEVEKNHDSEYIVNLFAALMAMIAVIVAIVIK